jgi:tetratricopeptide (TPR) repeat protein
VESLAQPYGVIFSDEVKAIVAKPAQQLSSYECVLQFQLYWRRFDAGRYGGVRDCLERAIAADPDDAEASASLALLYLDAYRFPLNDKRAIPGNPIARARQLAQRAVELSPQSTRAYRALQLAYWFAHDLPHSFEAGERGLALNPNDSETMAELGFRRCLIGEWQRGLPLVKEAFARNPALPDGYRVAIFLDDYMNGHYEEALAEANRIDLPNIVFGPVMQAMALAQLGRTVEARAAVDQVLAIDPAYGDKVVADLENRNVYPALIGIIAAGLRKAGLPVNGAPGLARAE